jgi:hypothetical protein
MKKMFAMMVSMALIVTVAASPVWAVGDKVRSDKAAGPAGETGDGDGQASRGTPVGESAQLLSVQDEVTGKKNQPGTTVNLTQTEIDALRFMREEEKLARDVYSELATVWDLGVFWNIAESEQQHMDAVLDLLEKYGIEDPALGPGEFYNEDLQGLYNDLMAKGGLSLIDALEVGVIIEVTDIEDIEYYLKLTDNKDIIQVFTNLLNGSENHLAAFNSHLGY